MWDTMGYPIVTNVIKCYIIQFPSFSSKHWYFPPSQPFSSNVSAEWLLLHMSCPLTIDQCHQLCHGVSSAPPWLVQTWGVANIGHPQRCHLSSYVRYYIYLPSGKLT